MTQAFRNPLTLDAGWAAVRAMIDELRAIFARVGADDFRHGARLLLDWLRPAEHLARLLLCAMAKTVTLAPLKARASVRRAVRRIGARVRSFHVLLPARGRGPRRTRTRVTRVRPPSRRRVLDDFEYFCCERPAPKPRVLSHLPFARPEDALAPDIAGRLAALARIAAAPLVAARRIARRYLTASERALRSLFAERRLHTDAPCLPTLILAHDLAWPFSPDTS